MNRIVWRGPLVAAHVRAAQIAGVNKTMGECVTQAKGLVHVDTGTLQGSIRLEGARPMGGGVGGQWGSFISTRITHYGKRYFLQVEAAKRIFARPLIATTRILQGT